MEKIISGLIDYLETKKKEYEEDGLVPTLDLLINDLKDVSKTN